MTGPVLVWGAHGLVGRRVVARWGEACVGVGREVDVRDARDVDAHVRRIAPRAVLLLAAFTAVDAAEQSAEAWSTNAVGPLVVARACAARGIPLWFVSTDHVFDGTLGRPLREDDPACPINRYGASKRAGELAVLRHRGRVVRTSWVLGEDGGVAARFLARAGETLNVVADAWGSPTPADALADALVALVDAPPSRAVPPLLHVAGPVGATWWHVARSLLGPDTTVHAVPASAHAAAARRPRDARLDVAQLRAWYGRDLPAAVGVNDVGLVVVGSV
jgi:dTDP-4-dehydrorhamnose reductase